MTPSGSSRRRANLVAVVVLVGVLVGALLWDRVGDDAGSSRDDAGVGRVDPRADADAEVAARDRAVAAQVSVLSRAWDARDRDAFVAGAGGTDAARAFGARTYDALEALEVRDVELRLVATDDGPAPGLVDAAVGVAWTPAGDERAVPTDEVEVQLRLQQTGRGWAVESAAAQPEAPLPLWLAGRVSVATVDGARVVTVGDREPDPRLRTLVADGVATVRDVLPRTGRAPVVVVPGSTAVAAELLGEAPDGLAQLAAVTTTPDGRADTAAGSVVVLNPDVFDRLGDADARLVVTHELTHALSEVSGETAPLWVVEGFADWVALRDDPRPVDELAAQYLAEVRRDGAPDALPSSQQFQAGTDALGATYEAAWTVFVVLAQQGDAEDVVAFYDAVRDGTPTGQALEQSLGLDEGQLLTRWRAWLVRRAG